MWSKVEQNGGCVLLFLNSFRCSTLWSCGFSSLRCNTPTVEACCTRISSHLPVQHNRQSKSEAKQKVVHAEPNVLFYNTNRPAALKSTPLPRLLLFRWHKLNSHPEHGWKKEKLSNCAKLVLFHADSFGLFQMSATAAAHIKVRHLPAPRYSVGKTI